MRGMGGLGGLGQVGRDKGNLRCSYSVLIV